MNNKAMKIFNFKQANFLIKAGCKIINTGYSHTDGKPYIRFVADDLFKTKMKEWQIKCNESNK